MLVKPSSVGTQRVGRRDWPDLSHEGPLYPFLGTFSLSKSWQVSHGNLIMTIMMYAVIIFVYLCKVEIASLTMTVKPDSKTKTATSSKNLKKASLV